MIQLYIDFVWLELADEKAVIGDMHDSQQKVEKMLCFLITD